jgi:DNA invertase Pin-like site-specific DNA recombinase
MKSKVKRAFSYIRFSDRKQAKGGSKRRQLEWGLALCASKGWQLDEHFRLQDEGVSAFRGTNATAGKLAAFLQAIKAGDVKAGDVLLLESLDRLSREDIDPAWELFRKILKSGVEVYTREPERHYVPSDLNNFGTRIEVQAYMLRAYNESATKSMRGLAYWKGRRDGLAGEPRPIHQVTPAWLRLSEDRKRFEIIQEAAETIRLIYRWAGEGLGLDPITKRLNELKIPPIGNNIRREVFKAGWCRSYVAKLLADKAVVGEFQPHVMKMVPDPESPDGRGKWKRVPHGDPIPGYFPEVIPEDEWYRIRQAVKERGRQTGPRGVGIASLFTGLIRDARDGETMHLTYAHSSLKANCRVLVSYGVRNGRPGSVHLPFPYDPVERAVLRLCRELKPADVLGDKADDRLGEISALSGRLQEIDDKIAKVQRRVKEEAGIDALVSLLEMLDRERKAAVVRLEQLKAESAHRQPTALRETQSVVELLERAEGAEREALRTKVKGRISQLVSEVWMLVQDVSETIRVARVQVALHSGRDKFLLLAWRRRGAGRGHVNEVMGAEVPADEPPEALRWLRDYRGDPKTRAYFDRLTRDTAFVAFLDEYLTQSAEGGWRGPPRFEIIPGGD